MSDSKKPPKRTKSGEVPAVQAYRAKLDSIEEDTLEKVRELNRKLDEEIKSTPPRRKDPRRDGDEETPEDVVTPPVPTQPYPPPMPDEEKKK